MMQGPNFLTFPKFCLRTFSWTFFFRRDRVRSRRYTRKFWLSEISFNHPCVIYRWKAELKCSILVKKSSKSEIFSPSYKHLKLQGAAGLRFGRCRCRRLESYIVIVLSRKFSLKGKLTLNTMAHDQVTHHTYNDVRYAIQQKGAGYLEYCVKCFIHYASNHAS